MVLPDGYAGKALALGLLAVMLGLGGLLIVRPMVTVYGEMAEELALLESQGARLARIEAALPAMRAQLAVLKQRQDEFHESLLLAGASDAVAAAALQTTVKKLGAASGAEITSVEILAPRSQDGFRRVGIRLVTSSDQPGLRALLHAFATSRPPLFVDSMDIRSNRAQPDARDSAKLSIALDIYGFRLEDSQAADGRG